MPRKKSKPKLEDQSTCPICYAMTGIGHAGKTLTGDDMFICHHCGRTFYENGKTIPEDEMKLIIERNVKENEEWEQKHGKN